MIEPIRIFNIKLSNFPPVIGFFLATPTAFSRSYPQNKKPKEKNIKLRYRPKLFHLVANPINLIAKFSQNQLKLNAKMRLKILKSSPRQKKYKKIPISSLARVKTNSQWRRNSLRSSADFTIIRITNRTETKH